MTTTKLINLRKSYYDYIDKKARYIGNQLAQRQQVTKLILDYIAELYGAAKSSTSFNDDTFRSAYHNPITSDLELLIARIIHHYSKREHLDWKIYLRCQKGKTAPDIRIESNSKTLCIIEIKAKAGWMQYLFSEKRFKKDVAEHRRDSKKPDPHEKVKLVKKQIRKYCETFQIKPKQIYFFLPSMTLVHRKKSGNSVDDYCNHFANKSGLPARNLILLSNNLLLNLSENPTRKSYEQTDNFDEFILAISHNRRVG